MARLQYGDSTGSTFELDESDLAHLAAVVTAKLRRREPFLLTLASGSGRESIWIHESSTLSFAYSGQEPAELDRKRLEAMVQSTNRPAGLTMTTTARATDRVATLAPAA